MAAKPNSISEKPTSNRTRKNNAGALSNSTSSSGKETTGRVRTRKNLRKRNERPDGPRKPKAPKSPKEHPLSLAERKARRNERMDPKPGRDYRRKRFSKHGHDLTALSHEVGYGSPSEKTKYKKGQSGNPKGRPKGRKNFETEFMEELSEKVTITENGKQLKISKQRALIKKWFQLAANGNPKALEAIHKMIEKYGASQAPQEQEEGLSAEDQAILDALLGKVTDASLQNRSNKKDHDDEQ